MTDYQRVWAQINLDNIAHNMQQVKKLCNAPIMGIVKGDAYGHGAVEISKVLLYNGADSLGVAIFDEGIQLRQNNIHVPILILGYTPEPKLYEVVQYNLTQTVFHYEMAENLSKIALKLNKTACIHIKIDTGMSRLGFMPNEKTINEICKIMALPNINIEGMYTHFATSDLPQNNFTYEQLDKFNYMINLLQKKGVRLPIVHAANSGGILHYNEAIFNLVRAGIILYGHSPVTDCQLQILKPAMSLKTRISYVKELDENVSIGYGRTFFTKHKSKIATIPVGYADGYGRSLSGKGRVLVKGMYAPIVGNICMDQFMIDITHIENVVEDDEVVLIGEQGGKHITIDEIATLQNTIHYEVMCNVGKRVPRVYIRNNMMLKTINSL